MLHAPLNVLLKLVQNGMFFPANFTSSRLHPLLVAQYFLSILIFMVPWQSRMLFIVYATQEKFSWKTVPFSQQIQFYIMWTRANISPLRSWTPNHFAPLVPKAHEISSYAEVVARGRKRMQKVLFEKKNENTAYSRENTPPLEKKQPYTTPPSKSQQKTQHTKQQVTKTLPDNQQQQKPSSKLTKPQQTTLSKKPQQQQTSLSKTPQQQPRSLFEKQDHPTNKDQKRTMLPEKQQQRKTMFPKEQQQQQKTTLREEQQLKKMFPNDQGQRSTFPKKQQQATTLPQRTISTAQYRKSHFKGEKASEKALCVFEANSI